MKTSIIPLLIIFLFATSIQIFATDNTETIKKYSSYYDTNITKYETEFRKAKLRGCVDYINNLQDMQAKFQSSGNLDGWEAVNKELARFRDKPVINEKASTPSELRKLQESYSTRINVLEQTKNRQIISLKNKYVAKLEELKLKWTKSGNFKDAFLARDEIKRINQSEKIKSSTCALEQNAETNDHPPAQATAKPTPTSKQQAPTKPITHGDKTVVHPPGHTPHASSAGYKRASLSRTKLSPWPSGINASMVVSSSKSRTSNRTTWSKTVESADERSVKISLRTSDSNAVKTDLRLLLQYFTKPAGRSSAPHCINTKNIPIKYLDKRNLIIEMAPVAIASSSTSYGSHSSHDDGYKFYGYILSLVNSDNKLIYQAVTERGLESEAEHLDMNTGNLDELRRRYTDARQERDNAREARSQDWSSQSLKDAVREAERKYEQASQVYHTAERKECNPCQ